MAGTDRITQLQEELDNVARLMFTSIGVLQRDAPAVPLDATPDAAAAAASNDDANALAQAVVTSCRRVDGFIDSLPGTEASYDEELVCLNKENAESVEELRALVDQADAWAKAVRQRVTGVASDRLALQTQAASLQAAGSVPSAAASAAATGTMPSSSST